MRRPANRFGARIRLRNEPQGSRTRRRGICTKQRRHSKNLHKRHSAGGSGPLLARRLHRPGAVLGSVHAAADVASGENSRSGSTKPGEEGQAPIAAWSILRKGRR
jgi:hypothetical protein